MTPEPKPPQTTDPRRSKIMKAVGHLNTAPELKLREWLSKLGLQFDTNRRDLPGTPDIVFTKERIAIFVHGCFWHRHENCRLATTPKSNTDYWNKKFEANKIRDKKKIKQLKETGWRVVIVWQCTLEKDPSKVAMELKDMIENKACNHSLFHYLLIPK